jgi:hypothetical protein
MSLHVLLQASVPRKSLLANGALEWKLRLVPVVEIVQFQGVLSSKHFITEWTREDVMFAGRLMSRLVGFQSMEKDEFTRTFFTLELFGFVQFEMSSVYMSRSKLLLTHVAKPPTLRWLVGFPSFSQRGWRWFPLFAALAGLVFNFICWFVMFTHSAPFELPCMHLKVMLKIGSEQKLLSTLIAAMCFLSGMLQQVISVVFLQIKLCFTDIARVNLLFGMRFHMRL